MMTMVLVLCSMIMYYVLLGFFVQNARGGFLRHRHFTVAAKNEKQIRYVVVVAVVWFRKLTFSKSRATLVATASAVPNS